MLFSPAAVGAEVGFGCGFGSTALRWPCPRRALNAANRRAREERRGGLTSSSTAWQRASVARSHARCRLPHIPERAHASSDCVLCRAGSGMTLRKGEPRSRPPAAAPFPAARALKVWRSADGRRLNFGAARHRRVQGPKGRKSIGPNVAAGGLKNRAQTAIILCGDVEGRRYWLRKAFRPRKPTAR